MCGELDGLDREWRLRMVAILLCFKELVYIPEDIVQLLIKHIGRTLKILSLKNSKDNQNLGNTHHLYVYPWVLILLTIAQFMRSSFSSSTGIDIAAKQSTVVSMAALQSTEKSLGNCCGQFMNKSKSKKSVRYQPTQFLKVPALDLMAVSICCLISGPIQFLKRSIWQRVELNLSASNNVWAPSDPRKFSPRYSSLSVELHLRTFPVWPANISPRCDSARLRDVRVEFEMRVSLNKRKDCKLIDPPFLLS